MHPIPQLIPGHLQPPCAHPSLAKLVNHCEAFDKICQPASELDDPDDDFLAWLVEELWALTQKICAEIDVLERVPSLQATLREIRHHHFEPKVLRWYRMNDEFDRFWTKPAGYSGDYHTIELLCQNEPPLARFEDVFLNHLLRCTMARQHWNKVLAHTKFLLRVLETSTNTYVKILDAGCGPSHDVRETMRWLQHECMGEMLLTDLDPQALRFSKAKLKNVRHGINFSFAQEDVLKTVRRLHQQGEAGTFDAIIFGGLFDYIPDRVLRLVLKQSRHLLKTSGEMLFSQVSRDNPDRTFMKWFGDWELIERSEDDLTALCTEAEIPAEQVCMWRERSNCAILCHIAKQGPPKYHARA